MLRNNHVLTTNQIIIVINWHCFILVKCVDNTFYFIEIFPIINGCINHRVIIGCGYKLKFGHISLNVFIRDECEKCF